MCNEESSLNLPLDSESNRLLTVSAKKSGRSKRKEVAMRLKDHLLRFESITSIGDVTVNSADS